MRNQGMHPDKVLLQSARVYSEVLDAKIRCCSAGGSAGFESSPSEEIAAVAGLKFGLDNMLIKPRGIAISGKAKLIDNHSVEITDGDKVSVITAENIIIATGSEPALVPAFNIDHKRIITSDEALNLMEIPKEMIVIGQVPWGLSLDSCSQPLVQR